MPLPEENPEPRPPTTVWHGIRLTLLLHLIQIPMGLLSFGISLLAIGLTQLIYMVPAFIVARKHKDEGTAQGLIIGASITFLLNGACWGVFWSSM